MPYSYSVFGSQAVELNCQRAVSRTKSDKVVRFQRLALVKSSKVEFSPAAVGAGAIFTPAEMRHNFAIWPLNKGALGRQRAHLYYCVRCKQAFGVNDLNGSVTALDPHGDVLQRSEAVERLRTFSCGPCPAFSGLTGQLLTSKVIPIRTAQGRVTELTSAGRRTWKVIVAQWHRLWTTGGSQNRTSKQK
jgi:hypothetical protein